MVKNWRLIQHQPADGGFNMDFDRRLSDEFIPNQSMPVFCIYGWKPACFSVGRFQDPEAVFHLEILKKNQIPFVKRMTGGGAIFHGEEITYSLVCSPDDLGTGLLVKESYEKICSFLLLFYSKLGLKAFFAKDTLHEKLGVKTAFCFAGKEDTDILIGGKKIGGNAQKRDRSKIFQHGSIPIKPLYRQSIPYLKENPEGSFDTITSLEELGIQQSREELIKLLINSFQESLNTNLIE